MNAAMVLSWVAIGFFNAYVATHLVKDAYFNHAPSNLAVGTFGALLGGLLMYAIVPERSYAHFLYRSVSAMTVSAIVIHFTRLLNRPGAHHRVS